MNRSENTGGEIPAEAASLRARVAGLEQAEAERERAEAARRMSEEEWRNLFENAQIGLYRSKVDGSCIVAANAKLAEILGCSIEELVGQPAMVRYANPSDREEVMQQLRKNGALTDYEVEVVAKSGEIRTCLISMKSYPERGYLEGSAIDITKRRRAEAALRRAHEELEARVAERTADLRSANERLRREIAERKEAEEALRQGQKEKEAILNSLVEHVLYHDMQMRILWANEAACESAGLPLEELAGRHCYEIWGQRADPCEDCPVAGARQTGRPHAVEKSTPDGRSWFVRGHPVRDGNGEITGLVELTLETTERKRAEEASRVYTRSMEQSRDGIIITDADSRITFANRAAEVFLRLAANEIIGRRSDEVFTIDRRTQDQIDASLKNEGSWSGLVEVAQHDADPLAIELTRLLISDERETPIASVSVIRDARYARRLESLQHVAEVAAGTDATDDEVVHKIMAHLPELVDTDRWSIFLHSPQNETLELRFFSEGERELAQAAPVLSVGNSLTGQVFRRGEVLVSADLLRDHRFSGNPTLHSMLPLVRRLNARAICILPLRAGSKTVGTLTVSDRRVRTFTLEEINVLKTLAGQIGLLLGRDRREQARRPRASQPRRANMVTVVAQSESMKRVINVAEHVAATDLPVLILGPTGVGKGHLAKYIHTIGPRADGPFLAVNCACLDGQLILSELFGHERGAFTGAVRQQKGCFELANGGMLLLDEVIELPDSAQAKLLQLVETQQFRRVGGQQTIATDVRIICTTNADIRECVRSGKLRQDLYYRLNTAEILMPPLRDRPEDVEPLAVAHLRTQSLATGEPVCRLTDGALARLREYHWPGNVRELQNVLSQASTHGSGVISARDLRFSPVVSPLADELAKEPAGRSERGLILDALRRHRWNRSLTAKELGIHRNTLRDRMRKYHITD